MLCHHLMQDFKEGANPFVGPISPGYIQRRGFKGGRINTQFVGSPFPSNITTRGSASLFPTVFRAWTRVPHGLHGRAPRFRGANREESSGPTNDLVQDFLKATNKRVSLAHTFPAHSIPQRFKGNEFPPFVGSQFTLLYERRIS